MYTSLIGTILLLDFWMKFIIGLGITSGILGTIWFLRLFFEYDIYGEIPFKSLALTLIFCITCVGTIVVGNSKFMDPNWVIIRAAAPVLDKYVEEHPEAIYNPDTILSVTNDTVLGVLESIQTFPDILKKISNGEILLPAEENSEEKEFEAFKRWKANQ